MYSELAFPTPSGRPFFYSNFVQTVDGKVQVSEQSQEYWPIGSRTDHATMQELRSYADVIVHGKHTAEGFRTFGSLTKFEVAKKRRGLGRDGSLTYAVVATKPDQSLLDYLASPPEGVSSLLVTTEAAVIPETTVPIVRIGTQTVDLLGLSDHFLKEGKDRILVEGGPTLMGSFIEADLIDELFVTIAPKLFGSKPPVSMTMIEGMLLPPERAKNLRLISAQPLQDELYLRYEVIR